MNCRGHDKRVDIVKNYNVIPVAHLKLLNGQEKHSDAGATITDDYYVFKLESKNSTFKIETITCGIEAANDFLRLIHHDVLPIFNPLITENDNRINGNDNSHVMNLNCKDRTARQLLNSINWIILIIDAKPNTPIYAIKNECEHHMDKEPALPIVKSVNTIIKKCFNNETLTTQINQLKEKNKIRENICDFSLLEKILLSNNEESFF